MDLPTTVFISSAMVFMTDDYLEKLPERWRRIFSISDVMIEL
jgi:hypothetical protein